VGDRSLDERTKSTQGKPPVVPLDSPPIPAPRDIAGQPCLGTIVPKPVPSQL